MGYRVEQSVEVKVRKVEDAGKIVAGLGTVGIQNIGGLSLEVEQYEKIVEEVRNEAIRDARVKAKERAKSLGISLGDVTSMNDGYGGGYMYARDAVSNQESKAGYNTAAVAPDMGPAPVIATGENKITANVSVTYEIK